MCEWLRARNNGNVDRKASYLRIYGRKNIDNDDVKLEAAIEEKSGYFSSF